MVVQLNWKNPKTEPPKEKENGGSVCVLATVSGAQYPVKAWASDLGYYTVDGDMIPNEYIVAWDYCPENFNGQF